MKTSLIMNKLLLLPLLFHFSNFSFSQPTIQKIYGQAIYQEGANDIQKTIDGGYIIGGYAYRPQTFGANDLYLLKIDNACGIQFGKLWGRTGYKDAISSIRQTSDSGYIMLTKGQLSAGGNFNSSLVKTNSQGAILWNKYFQNGTSSMNNANVENTADGGFIVATSQYVSSGSLYITNLQKFDSNGDTLWTSVYSSVGGSDVLRVKQTTDHGYIIGGEAKGAANVGTPFLLKTDSAGIIQWYKTYALNGFNDLTWFEITSDGGFVFTGTRNSYSLDSSKVFVVKTDSIGNPFWAKIYDNIDAISASKIIETSNGDLLVTGSWLDSTHTNNDVLAMKVSDTGNMLWSKRYGGPKYDYGTSLLDLPVSGHIIVGYYGTPNGAYPEIYLIQTDLSGNSGCNENNLTINSNNLTIQLDTIIITQYHLPYTISSLTYNSGIAIDQTTFCSTVGTSDFEMVNSINLFPNPAVDFVELSIPDNIKTCQVSIVDNLGNEISTRRLKHSENIITSGMAEGIYYIRVLLDEKPIIKKLIIIH